MAKPKHLQLMVIVVNRLNVDAPCQLSVDKPQCLRNCRDSVQCLSILETETDRLVARPVILLARRVAVADPDGIVVQDWGPITCTANQLGRLSAAGAIHRGG